MRSEAVNFICELWPIATYTSATASKAKSFRSSSRDLGCGDADVFCDSQPLQSSHYLRKA